MKYKRIESDYGITFPTAGTGPYVDFKTNIYVKNVFDKSNHPIGAVFEIIEKGSQVDADNYFIIEGSSAQGYDVLGRPNSDVTHIIKVDKDKLHYLPSDGYSTSNYFLTVRVYLKDLNISFVNLTSPTFEGVNTRTDGSNTKVDHQTARARLLTVSAYLVFPRFITEKMTYNDYVCYDGFQGMWFMCHNKYHNGTCAYTPYDYLKGANDYIYYRKYPRISKTMVATQQEAASLTYDVSPRQLIITDPFFRIQSIVSDMKIVEESLYLPLCENKEGSYLTVYVYDNNTKDKEFIGSFTKEWNGVNGWGDAKFRDNDNILRLDFPAELTAKIKYEHTYYYYVTFYNPLIGECGYTSQLQPFTPTRIYGLNTTTTITPHIKGENTFYADINITETAVNTVNGTAMDHDYNVWTHIKVLDPITRNMIRHKVIYLDSRYKFSNISTHIGYKKIGDNMVFSYNKSYIIQVMVEYEYNGFYYDYNSSGSVKRNSYGMYGFLTKPYEQLVVFDTIDNDCNPLTTPAYKGEVRISREDKMVYIKLPQFKSFVGDVTLKQAQFWLYADSHDRNTGNYACVDILWNEAIPIDKVPLIESNSDTTEEYAIPLSDEALYIDKVGYDYTAGWDEYDYVLPVNNCEVRYTATSGHSITIKLNNGNLKCVDQYLYGYGIVAED